MYRHNMYKQRVRDEMPVTYLTSLIQVQIVFIMYQRQAQQFVDGGDGICMKKFINHPERSYGWRIFHSNLIIDARLTTAALLISRSQKKNLK